MSPRLRVLAGTGTTLTSITHLVNTTNAFSLVSDRFEGELVVCIKGLNHPEKDAYDYFERPERQGITWSIQVRGRFLEHILADDVLFGNTFDRPLGLPWGSGAALRFMSCVDPTLEHDLTSRTHPWALSPLIATMPYFAHARIADDRDASDYLAFSATTSAQVHEPTLIAAESSFSSFPPNVPIVDDTSQLHLARRDASASSTSTSGSSSSSSVSPISSPVPTSPSSPYLVALGGRPQGSSNASSTTKRQFQCARMGKRKKDRQGLGLAGASQRRAYFASAAHRQDITFGPRDIIMTDFCYGFLEFNPSLALRLPGGISFDLMRYWDGQPVRFVCCKRKPPKGDQESGQLPWGPVFWSVVIEMDDDETIAHQRSRELA